MKEWKESEGSMPGGKGIRHAIIKEIGYGGVSKRVGHGQRPGVPNLYLPYFTFTLPVNLWNGTPKKNISAGNKNQG